MQLEDLNRRVWGDKITLATMNHALGGVGVGLLIAREKRRRPLAIGFVTFSLAAHVYAWLTRDTTEERNVLRQKLAA